jgi:hypothetical protein
MKTNSNSKSKKKKMKIDVPKLVLLVPSGPRILGILLSIHEVQRWYGGDPLSILAYLSKVAFYFVHLILQHFPLNLE